MSIFCITVSNYYEVRLCLQVQGAIKKNLCDQNRKKGKSRRQVSLLRITMAMGVDKNGSRETNSRYCKVVLNDDAFTEQKVALLFIEVKSTGVKKQQR